MQALSTGSADKPASNRGRYVSESHSFRHIYLVNWPAGHRFFVCIFSSSCVSSRVNQFWICHIVESTTGSMYNIWFGQVIRTFRLIYFAGHFACASVLLHLAIVTLNVAIDLQKQCCTVRARLSPCSECDHRSQLIFKVDRSTIWTCACMYMYMYMYVFITLQEHASTFLRT